jgi:hypothetical protein
MLRRFRLSTTVNANERATDDVCCSQKILRRAECPAYQRHGRFRGPFRRRLRGPFRGRRFRILTGMAMRHDLDREEWCSSAPSRPRGDFSLRRLSRRIEAHADQLRGGSAGITRGGTRTQDDVSDQKNLSAEVREKGFAEVRAEDVGAHFLTWQRVRAKVESATSR